MDIKLPFLGDVNLGYTPPNYMGDVEEFFSNIDLPKLNIKMPDLGNPNFDFEKWFGSLGASQQQSLTPYLGNLAGGGNSLANTILAGSLIGATGALGEGVQDFMIGTDPSWDQYTPDPELMNYMRDNMMGGMGGMQDALAHQQSLVTGQPYAPQAGGLGQQAPPPPTLSQGAQTFYDNLMNQQGSPSDPGAGSLPSLPSWLEKVGFDGQRFGGELLDKLRGLTAPGADQAGMAAGGGRINVPSGGHIEGGMFHPPMPEVPPGMMQAQVMPKPVPVSQAQIEQLMGGGATTPQQGGGAAPAQQMTLEQLLQQPDVQGSEHFQELQSMFDYQNQQGQWAPQAAPPPGAPATGAAGPTPFQGAINNVEGAVAQQQGGLPGLQAAIQAQQAAINPVTQSAGLQQQAVNAMQGQLGNQGGSIQDVLAALQRQEAAIDPMNQTLAQAQGSIGDVQSAISEAARSVAPYRQMLGQAEGSIGDFRQAIARGEQSLKPMIQDLGQARQSIDPYTDAISRMEQSIRPQQEVLGQQAGSIQDYMGAVQRMEQGLDPMREALQAQGGLLGEQRGYVQDLHGTANLTAEEAQALRDPNHPINAQYRRQAMSMQSPVHAGMNDRLAAQMAMQQRGGYLGALGQEAQQRQMVTSAADQATAQGGNLAQGYSGLVSQLGNVAGRYGDTSQLINMLRQGHGDVTGQLGQAAGLRGAVPGMYTDIAQGLGQVAGLQNQAASMYGQIPGIMTQIGAGYGDIAGLMQGQAGLQAQIPQLLAQIASGQGQAAGLQAGVTQGYSDVSQLQNMLTNQFGSAANMQGNVGQSYAQAAGLQAGVTEGQNLYQNQLNQMVNSSGMIADLYNQQINQAMGLTQAQMAAQGVYQGGYDLTKPIVSHTEGEPGFITQMAPYYGSLVAGQGAGTQSPNSQLDLGSLIRDAYGTPSQGTPAGPVGSGNAAVDAFGSNPYDLSGEHSVS